MKPRMNFYQAAPDTIKALVALEEQILHVLRHANGDFIQHLHIGRRRDIQPLRRRQQDIRGNPRIRTFEDDRIAQPVETVGRKLAAAIVFADDLRDMCDRLVVLRGCPAEVAPGQGSDNQIFSRGELTVEV